MTPGSIILFGVAFFVALVIAYVMGKVQGYALGYRHCKAGKPEIGTEKEENA